jgi:hypothetical protein
VVSNSWDGGYTPPSGREERPTTVPGLGPAVAPPAAVPASAAPPPALGHTWSESFAPPSRGSTVEVVHLETAKATHTGPERPRLADQATGDRRASVLSYDEVHRVSSPRRSKAPIVWAAVAILVIAVAGVVAGPRIGALLKGSGKADDAAPRQAAGPTEPGGFKITTQPPGSRITIDGTPRGKAPLRVDGLAPGLHSIVVESDWGTLEEAVAVESGKVVPLALATVGWIKVEAPVELEVSEEGRVYGRTSETLMVPAGRHAFIFSNKSVAVRHRQFVQVPGGQTVNVPLELPQGMLNLTSEQPAQVLLDGEVIGDTPQVSVSAALGPHEVIFRSPRYGDVSYSVNVTLAAPVSLSANFGAKR